SGSKRPRMFFGGAPSWPAGWVKGKRRCGSPMAIGRARAPEFWFLIPASRRWMKSSGRHKVSYLEGRQLASADPATLSIFNSLLAAIADEMGLVLGRSALSPNIKERRDYSCAVFDRRGAMVAQAAHIPVHLGAMPASVE